MTEMDRPELVSTAQMTELEQNVLTAFSDQPIDLLNRVIAFIKERDGTRLQHDAAGLTGDEDLLVQAVKRGSKGPNDPKRLVAIIDRLAGLTVTERTGGEEKPPIQVNGPGPCVHGKPWLTYCPECEAAAKWNTEGSQKAMPAPQPAPPGGEHDPDLTTEGLARIKTRSLPSAEVIADIEKRHTTLHALMAGDSPRFIHAIEAMQAHQDRAILLSLLKAMA